MFIYLCSLVKLCAFIPSQLAGWKACPSDKPLASMYVKLFGQEIAYANIDKSFIDYLIQVNPLCQLHVRIFDICFQYKPDIRHLLGDFASRLPGNSHLPLWAKQLSKPWRLVSVCISLNRCWWLRPVTSFPPPLGFPWNLASTRPEWLLLEWTVNTALLWVSPANSWSNTQY